MADLDLKQIQQYAFPETQFIKEETPKSQIYLHHTAGNPYGVGVFDYWKSTADRVATCIAISGKSPNGKWKDGQIVQGYSSRYWAYHLGLTNAVFQKFGLPYKPLDKNSIAIEVCNWGYLTETARGWESYAGALVAESDVVEYATPFKGHKYYQRYTPAQIESVRQLLVYWNKIYGIPVKFLGMEIFDLDRRALAGEKGVFTHNSVRSDKSDIHPQPEMIQMLQSL